MLRVKVGFITTCHFRINFINSIFGFRAQQFFLTKNKNLLCTVLQRFCKCLVLVVQREAHSNKRLPCFAALITKSTQKAGLLLRSAFSRQIFEFLRYTNSLFRRNVQLAATPKQGKIVSVEANGKKLDQRDEHVQASHSIHMNVSKLCVWERLGNMNGKRVNGVRLAKNKTKD